MNTFNLQEFMDGTLGADFRDRETYERFMNYLKEQGIKFMMGQDATYYDFDEMLNNDRRILDFSCLYTYDFGDKKYLLWKGKTNNRYAIVHRHQFDIVMDSNLL